MMAHVVVTSKMRAAAPPWRFESALQRAWVTVKVKVTWGWLGLGFDDAETRVRLLLSRSPNDYGYSKRIG